MATPLGVTVPCPTQLSCQAVLVPSCVEHWSGDYSYFYCTVGDKTYGTDAICIFNCPPGDWDVECAHDSDSVNCTETVATCGVSLYGARCDAFDRTVRAPYCERCALPANAGCDMDGEKLTCSETHTGVIVLVKRLLRDTLP